jgi:hypothetical protein
LEQLEYEAYGCHTEIKMIKKTIRLDDYFKISIIPKNLYKD